MVRGLEQSVIMKGIKLVFLDASQKDELSIMKHMGTFTNVVFGHSKNY